VRELEAQADQGDDDPIGEAQLMIGPGVPDTMEAMSLDCGEKRACPMEA
jgi:hypothetical protein